MINKIEFAMTGILKWLNRIMLPFGIAFLIIGLIWGPMVNAVGKPMPADNRRTAFIKEVTLDYSQKAGIEEPELTLSTDQRAPLSVRTLYFPGTIALPATILNPEIFNDNDVRAIIAHEIGHILRWDTYRYYKKISSQIQRDIELEADKEGVTLAGCVPMQDLFRRHYKEALGGWMSEEDPHPHPDDRIAVASNCK